jgi:hypothetical protein
MLVMAAKIHLEKQTLAAGMKQRKQADKALLLNCFVFSPLLVLPL